MLFTDKQLSRKLIDIYRRLYRRYGPQHWWPGDTAFEMAVGAILTQNTNWGNVERAISNLTEAGALSPEALHRMPAHRLAPLIRPAGYFNVKARRLKNFIDMLVAVYGGSMKKMRHEESSEVRSTLLGVNGIGPETADSILLYALNKPVFVIDAYTKRVLSRHAVMDHEESYEAYQELFHRHLKKDAGLFNEFHALFVRVAKEHCRTKPHCSGCPLEGV